VERLGCLPIRALTARQVMSVLPEEIVEGSPLPADWSRSCGIRELDPGWILGERTLEDRFDPIKLVAERPWWPAGVSVGPLAESFQRLWRHSVAVSLAARSVAREAGDPDPNGLSQAGLLHGLGRWAVAAVDPEWIVRWLNEQAARSRHDWEMSELGTDLCDLGRRLAERWGCDPLVVEAAWLHDQPAEALDRAATEPRRLALIQQAFRWAESTPWALSPAAGQESMPADPRLRILVAEVQSRCGSLFASNDATSHEEQMTQQTARLTLRLLEARRRGATQERLLQALAGSDPAESTESWADRASMVWCAEPEVNAARVVWLEARGPAAAGAEADRAGEETSRTEPAAGKERPPTLVLPLKARGRPLAEIRLWCDRTLPDLRQRLDGTAILLAWEAWASLVANRTVLERRLQAVVAAVRDQLHEDEAKLQQAKLEALAEFAAGAGHELNNPLAVIVGRAQLLMGRAADPETARSLRIILGQAQRTHRILRDLMFVARPPAPRPRACRPSEILRACLAGFEEECDARGIRLIGELDAADPQTWSDPEALHHLAEILIRNAVQATPAGGKIQVRSGSQGNDLRWWFCDSGKGISPEEGAHLFDPFFCGRQAGRGLGLGLPRASRIVSLAGGTLKWSSSLGQGTVFQVQLPLTNPPDQLEQDRLSPRGPLALSGTSPKT
jgi:signal transduction histidine kinase